MRDFSANLLQMLLPEPSFCPRRSSRSGAALGHSISRSRSKSPQAQESHTQHSLFRVRSPLADYYKARIEGWLSDGTTERATSPLSMHYDEELPSVIEVDYGNEN